MNLLKIPQSEHSCVSQVSIQVSEYSEANGGTDAGCIYAVEVLFPDGTWANAGHSRDLKLARAKAASEAVKRNAIVLPQSLWLTRQISR